MWFVKWPLLVHGAHGSLLSLVSFGRTCAGQGGGGAGWDGARWKGAPEDLTFCSHSLVSLFPGMQQVLSRCLKVLPPLGESSTDEFVYSTLLP